MRIQLRLTPGQIIPVQVGQADFLAVIFSPGDVEIKFPRGEFELFGQGDSFTMPPGESFVRFEARNPSQTATISVQIYAGMGRYEQRRQSVIEPATEFAPSSTATLAPSTGISFTGFPDGARIRRKSIQISNLETSLPIQMRDAAGVVGLSIAAGHSVTLPISEFVEIYNPQGSTVSVAISEIWWTL